jgi:hypothetical protein
MIVSDAATTEIAGEILRFHIIKSILTPFQEQTIQEHYQICLGNHILVLYGRSSKWHLIKLPYLTYLENGSQHLP